MMGQSRPCIELKSAHTLFYFNLLAPLNYRSRDARSLISSLDAPEKRKLCAYNGEQ